MEDAVQNTLLRVVNTISGCSGTENGIWELRGIENFTIRKTILKNCKKKANFENIKNVADFDEEEKG